MSRTDNTRPYWVRCNDELEEMRYAYHSCMRYRYRGAVECTIDEPRKSSRFYYTAPCGYHLDLSQLAFRPSSITPFVHEYYHGPERRRVREELDDARRLFNAGELEEGFDVWNRQGRNSVKWLMW
jgi:hypothetical protein